MGFAEDKLTIETPEQIELEYPLAGIGSRFLALAIDTLLQVAVYFFLFWVAVGVLWSGFRSWGLAAVVLAYFSIYWGYFTGFEIAWKGQTPGKRWAGIRVINASGRSLTPFEAVARNLMRIIDQFPFCYGIGCLAVFLTRRSQRLGDLVAGTVVVYERKPEDTQQPFWAPRSSSSAPRVTSAGLTAEELALIEAFLARRYDLPPDIRRRTGERLEKIFRPRVAGGEAEAAQGEDLLEALVRQARESPTAR